VRWLTVTPVKDTAVGSDDDVIEPRIGPPGGRGLSERVHVRGAVASEYAYRYETRTNIRQTKTQ